MTRFKKVSAILMCVCLLLSGCADGGEAAPTEDAAAAMAQTPAPTGAPAGSRVEIPADTLVLTAGGLPVYWEEFHYWMQTALANVLNYDGVSEVADWDAVFSLSQEMYGETLTYGEFMVRYATDAVILYRTIDSRFAEENLTLNEDELFSQEEFMAYYGLETQEDFEAFLAEQFMTPELYAYIEAVSVKYYGLMEALYGPEGETLSDEEVLAYADAEGYIQAKHILISTLDDSGAAYPEEELAARYATAEDIYARLTGYEGDELEGYFDELISEFGEDPGQGADGYLFGSGVMMAAFEEAAGALTSGAFSGIVETSYGYHIILRTETDPDRVPNNESNTLRGAAAYTLFDEIVSDWQENLTVEYEDAYERIVPAEVF